MHQTSVMQMSENNTFFLFALDSAHEIKSLNRA